MKAEPAYRFVTERGAEAVRLEREERARDALDALWRGKWRIVALVAAAELFALGGLLTVKPRYTTTAIVEFSFNSDRPASATGAPSVIGADANALVESAAQLVRSRNIAAAASDALQLERDKAFAHGSTVSHALNQWRAWLGLQAPLIEPAPREQATSELMRRLTISHEPHTYVISIAATGDTPDQAAALANTVAAQYLRAEKKLALESAKSAARQEIANLAEIYGERHPSYVRAQAELKTTQRAIEALADPAASHEDDARVAGRVLHAAEVVAAPSSPDVKLYFELAGAMGVAAGVAAALGLQRAGGPRQRSGRDSRERRS